MTPLAEENITVVRAALTKLREVATELDTWFGPVKKNPTGQGSVVLERIEIVRAVNEIEKTLKRCKLEPIGYSSTKVDSLGAALVRVRRGWGIRAIEISDCLDSSDPDLCKVSLVMTEKAAYWCTMPNVDKVRKLISNHPASFENAPVYDSHSKPKVSESKG